jgi:SAM-dependent methyltransferase
MTTGDAGAPPPGQPYRGSTIAHAGRVILGPMTGDQLDALLDGVALPAAGRALDIGCGKGDLLVRLAQRGLGGVGVDRNPALLADARGLTERAGVGDRVAFVQGDAVEVERSLALPEGFDVVACIGATGALGGPVSASTRLRALARPGGLVLIGEGFWRSEPTPAQLAEFGMEPGELVDREETLARMAVGGLSVIRAIDATQAGWDAYEAAYAGALDAWTAANPADPDADEFRALASLFRDTWHAWRREAMGFAVAALRARAA